MPRTYSSIEKIRAELTGVNESQDPNRCGCRLLLCCENSSHRDQRVSDTRRLEVKRLNQGAPSRPTPGTIADDPGALFKQGEVIHGLYQVEDVLAGGMGIVYICRLLDYEEARNMPVAISSNYDRSSTAASKATPNRGPTYAAIKAFRGQLLFHGDVRERFSREALLWVSLWPHPNIVRAKTFDQGASVLLLEFVDGGNPHVAATSN